MKIIDLESYKFKAESLKQFGLVICTPFSIIVLKILLREFNLNELIFTIELALSFIFFILGFILINRSVDIITGAVKDGYQ